MALVESDGVDDPGQTGLADRRRRAAAAWVGEDGEPATIGSGRSGASAFDQEGNSVWSSGVGQARRQATGRRIDPPSARPTSEVDRRQDEKVAIPSITNSAYEVRLPLRMNLLKARWDGGFGFAGGGPLYATDQQHLKTRTRSHRRHVVSEDVFN